MPIRQGASDLGQMNKNEYNRSMIAHLEGTIIHISDKFVVIDVAGVGYKVYASADAQALCTQSFPITLWIYTAVRETALDLYGFATIEEMEFFELLLDVSGIGPKSALSILSVAPLDTLKRAIATGDMSYLNKVSGIGKKTAEKIIVELRDKLEAHKGELGGPSSLRDESDIIEALKSLGYNQNEAREALKHVPATITGTNARIKEALKLLGGK